VIAAAQFTETDSMRYLAQEAGWGHRFPSLDAAPNPDRINCHRRRLRTGDLLSPTSAARTGGRPSEAEDTPGAANGGKAV
jgi:hypothetical protein